MINKLKLNQDHNTGNFYFWIDKSLFVIDWLEFFKASIKNIDFLKTAKAVINRPQTYSRMFIFDGLEFVSLNTDE